MTEKIEKNATGGIIIWLGEGGGQIVLTRKEIIEIIMLYLKEWYES